MLIVGLICFYSFIICLILYLNTKKLYNPLFIYLLFWMIIIFLSSLHLNGLYEVREEVYIMFGAGMLSFSLGFAMMPRISFKELNSTNSDYKIRYKLIYFFLFIVILFSLQRLSTVFSSLSQGISGESIRYMFYEYDSEDQTSRYSFYLQTFIITPIIYASAVIMVLDIFMGIKNKILIFLTIIANVLFLIVSGGGRVIIMNIIFHIIFTMMILNKKFELSKSTKRKLKNSIFILLIIFLGANSFRGKESALLDLLNEAYKYYAGSIQHFQVRIDRLESIRDYGISFLAGYLRPIFLILGLFGIKSPNSYNIFLFQNSLLQGGVQIGNGVWYNAFATMNFHFYLSFGFFGILLGNFIYGLICAKAYKAVQKNSNFLSIGILLLILQGLLTSMVRWQFSISTYALSFLYLRIFLKNTTNFFKYD